MKPAKVLFDIVLVTVIMFLSNYLYDGDLLYRGWLHFMMLFGMLWAFISVLTFFHWPEECMTGIKFGIIIAIVSAVISVTYYPELNAGDPKKEELDQQTIGKCPEAEWVVVVIYRDKYGCSNERHFEYIGPVDGAESFVEAIVKTWNDCNPESEIQRYYKCLISVPRDWLKKNKYPVGLKN